MLVAYYKATRLDKYKDKKLKTLQDKRHSKRIKGMVGIAKEWRKKGFNTILSINKNEALLEVHDE